MDGLNILLLKTKDRMGRELDPLLGECLLEELPVRKALSKILPVLCRYLDCRDVLIRIKDEEGKRVFLKSEHFRSQWSALIPWNFPKKGFAPWIRNLPEGHLLLVSLYTGDRVIGLCGFIFRDKMTPRELKDKVELAAAAAELLNKYMKEIAAAARKRDIMLFSIDALRNRIFEAGADTAIKRLSDELSLEQFLLVYGDTHNPFGDDLCYRFYDHGEMVHNSIDSPDSRFLDLLRNKDKSLNEASRSFTELLDSHKGLEIPLRNGRDQNLIGKMVFKPGRGGLAPVSRDILRLFAECLCLRLFDYSREYRFLSKSFCAGDVQRLLNEPGFYSQYLTPREENVVILNADLTFFTSLCEEVLENSSEIGNLINLWSRKVLEVLYRYDGVLSKMIGNSFIGLFGPPFFESSMEKRAKDAIAAAEDILKETMALGASLGLEERIRDAGLGEVLTTSNGIHYGPASVGFFGPNKDYTGFSSAMNHTARLHEHAEAGDVLVTEKVLSLLPGGPLGIRLHDGRTVDFEGPRMIVVKKVSEPLDYFRCIFG